MDGGQIVPDAMLDAPWPPLPQITGRQATELLGSAEGLKRLEEMGLATIHDGDDIVGFVLPKEEE